VLIEYETWVMKVGKLRYRHFARIDNTGLSQNQVVIGC